MDNNTLKMMRSLEGLATGDAFGELFFQRCDPEQITTTEQLPAGPWHWTDDTSMALGIAEILRYFGYISQDVLAEAFAKRFAAEPINRHYGYGAILCLNAIRSGIPWTGAAASLFSSQGSYGNGAAMRVAPLGAFFYDADLPYVVSQARDSAAVTHAHPEGQAGAIAVAVAASLAANGNHPGGAGFIERVLEFVPRGETRARLAVASDLPDGTTVERAAAVLGCGHRVSAPDTVPFCLWVASRHLDDYAGALWETVKGGGDLDTTCAIVGGIVALSADVIPVVWRDRREPLPPGYGEPFE